MLNQREKEKERTRVQREKEGTLYIELDDG